MIEKWASMEDLQAHMKAKHFVALGSDLQKNKIKINIDMRKSCL